MLCSPLRSQHLAPGRAQIVLLSPHGLVPPPTQICSLCKCYQTPTQACAALDTDQARAERWLLHLWQRDLWYAGLTRSAQEGGGPELMEVSSREGGKRLRKRQL